MKRLPSGCTGWSKSSWHLSIKKELGEIIKLEHFFNCVLFLFTAFKKKRYAKFIHEDSIACILGHQTHQTFFRNTIQLVSFWTTCSIICCLSRPCWIIVDSFRFQWFASFSSFFGKSRFCCRMDGVPTKIENTRLIDHRSRRVWITWWSFFGFSCKQSLTLSRLRLISGWRQFRWFSIKRSLWLANCLLFWTSREMNPLLLFLWGLFLLKQTIIKLILINSHQSHPTLSNLAALCQVSVAVASCSLLALLHQRAAWLRFQDAFESKLYDV